MDEITCKLTLDNLETASETQPLYSSGFFLTNASINEDAAVTTPMCYEKQIIF